ncbi:MAG: mechanosensitive ion channel [Pirellulales bacterium]|nr:mechanosensitive ion channel [Pirellulales bacterium]
MSRANRCLRLLMQTVVWLSVTAAMPVPAETSKPPSDETLIEQINAGKKQLDEKSDLDESLKAKARELFDEALAEMEKAKAAAVRIAAFERQVAQAPDLKQTKADLAALPAGPSETDFEGVALPEIEQEVSKREADLDRWRKELAEVDGELKGRAERRAELPKRLSTARQVLTEANNELKAPAPADAGPLVQAARRFMLLARQRAAEREILACEKELDAYDARAELLPLLHDLGARRVALAEGEIKRSQKIVNGRRQQEAEQQARQATREAGLAHPAVERLMEENTKLAKLRKSLAEQIADATRQFDEVDTKLERLRKEFASVEKKVKAVGLANVVGVMLRKWRAALPDLRNYHRNVGLRQEAMGAGELARLELQEERFELSNLGLQTQIALEDLDLSAQGGNQTELETAVREALEAKRNYLDALIADHETYYENLVDLKTAEQGLIDEAERCRRFIDERVLWIASAAPLGLADVAHSGKALVWLAGPGAWLDAGWTLIGDALRKPILWAVAMVVVLLLIFWRRRFRLRIAEIGEKAARGSCYRFLPTVETVALTALAAVVWPGLAWWLGWRLRAAADAGDFCKAIGAGLIIGAGVYLVYKLLWQACCGKGLGEAHFGWSASALKLLRHNLRWLGMSVLPLAFVAVVMGSQNNGEWDNSLGRICFVAAISCFAIFTQRILRPTGGVFQAIITYQRGGWLDRFRYLWYPSAVLMPASLAVLAAAGYYYTAQHLAVRLAATICLLVGAVMLRAVLLRWILVNKRKLAIEEARRRRTAQCEAAGGDEAPVGDELPASNEPDRDVAVIDAQTRRLIEYSLAMAAALALWCAWVDVLPALNILNSFKIPLTDLTLANLGMAALILATTTIAAKNIPGLLEMAVLQYLPLDAGARYAVATISRYLITIAGTIFCFGALGVGWSKVQWLVAAMSLGLGFGLQEIFANFVSGLIILFERPVRVGDVVTIDDISGVVSRIRIRATTITDWDRKELIIPNKEFITGRVLNWTLSNQVNRVVVEVGVAYGADTELATRLLMEVAHNHPIVLKDPSPHVVFDSFGASALNFVMRCYLPNMENRLTVIHDLHMAVDREFRAAGIEIAFPQQDVHIRSLNVPIPMISGLADEQARRGHNRSETGANKLAG